MNKRDPGAASSSPVTLPTRFEGEQLRIVTGARSKATIIIAVHSTVLGAAIGGCRLRQYPSLADGLTDVLRLSQAMTYKCAIGGIAAGGAKTVVIASEPFERRHLLLDVGDAVQALDGAYYIAVDIGTTANDMVTVKERTSRVVGLPESAGGSGDPSDATSRGVLTSIHALAQHLFGSDSVSGRHFAISGLGQVGSRLALALAAQGARLTVADLDSSKKSIAAELNADWVEPDQALTTQADFLVPAGVGGVIGYDLVGRLRCTAIVGPANNQLTELGVADAVHARGVLWAPDFLVNGGGVVYAGAIDVEQLDKAAANAEVEAIGATLTEALESATAHSTTPLTAALAIAEKRLHAAVDGNQ